MRLDAGPRPRALRRPRSRSASYLGAGDAFDSAIAEFSELYADQNERDHAALVAAIDSGPHRGRGGLSVARKAGAGAAGLILLTLCAGQFLMMLDSSVMNVSIATVAKDVGTTVTGIQTAITLYTLVMASFMITGGKIGQIIGRKRAFAIGCVIYGCGSLTTALAPNLPVLLIGWSCLEGLGAALILPAIVALVAVQLRPRGTAPRLRAGRRRGGDRGRGRPDRRRPLHHLLSWRYVFAGEVLIVIAILVLARRIEPATPERKVRLDLVGTALSALGLGLIVLGILRSGTWGFVKAKPDAPEWLGLSPVIWLILGGGAVLLAVPRPGRTASSRAAASRSSTRRSCGSRSCAAASPRSSSSTSSRAGCSSRCRSSSRSRSGSRRSKPASACCRSPSP